LALNVAPPSSDFDCYQMIRVGLGEYFGEFPFQFLRDELIAQFPTDVRKG
jgi:hypothetical protein